MLKLFEYKIILFNLKLVICLSLIILIISYILTTFNKLNDFQKLSIYECGFQPFEDARHIFDIKYYIIGILFVIFDLEIIFLFPWSVSISSIGIGYLNILCFILLLCFGLIYELLKDALLF